MPVQSSNSKISAVNICWYNLEVFSENVGHPEPIKIVITKIIIIVIIITIIIIIIIFIKITNY